VKVKLYFLPADKVDKANQDSCDNKRSESNKSNGSVPIVTAGSALELMTAEDDGDDDSSSDTDDDDEGCLTHV